MEQLIGFKKFQKAKLDQDTSFFTEKHSFVDKDRLWIV